MPKTTSSNEASRYVWLHWRILGMHPYKSLRCLYFIYSVLVKCFLLVIEPIHILLSVHMLSNDFIRILDLLSIGLSQLSSAVKQAVQIPYTQTSFQEARKLLRKLDAYTEGNVAEQAVLRRSVSFCHRLYVFYTSTFASAWTIFSIVALLRHKQMFEAWFPFDWQGSYWIYATLYQMFAACLQIVQNICNDVYPPTYLELMVTHYRLLNMRIARVGTDRRKTIAQNNRELIQCIINYKEVSELYDCVEPVISLTMLAQFISTAFIMCMSAVYFMISKRELADLLRVLIFLSLNITEILPCCWYVNELMLESAYLTTALYNCQWYAQDQCFRRTLIIFMQRSQKDVTILAGNLTPVTLQTFISIIRFTFSMFTILNQMKTA